jgi:YVTN family beta-propeller protein
VANASDERLYTIFAQTNQLLGSVKVGNNPVGVATDPSGARVFVANAVSRNVSVVDAANNSVVATVGVGVNPSVFGAFVGGTPSAPPSSCDDQLAALQAQLDAANATIASLTAQNSTLQGQVSSLQSQLKTANATIASLTAQISSLQAQVSSLQNQLNAANSTIANLTAENKALKDQIAPLQQQIDTLKAENAKLKSALDAADKTIDSFVNRLFKGKTDINVALAARDEAQQQLTLAIAKAGTKDYRVKRAQSEFNRGLSYLAEGRYASAVYEFRETFEIARRVLR